MNTDVSTNWHVELKDRIRALRESLKLTQDLVAERSGGNLLREEMVKLESGRNKASTIKIRNGLALGFGATREEIDSLIEGTLSPKDLAGVIRKRGVVPGKILEEIRSLQPLALAEASPLVLTLNQYPQWPEWLERARIVIPGYDDVFWDRIGGARPPFPDQVNAKTVIKLARSEIEDLE